ncbi:MAG: Na+/H+ antiporter subunit B [Anaerolineales bacterium]|nr:Na+/H+ antiporter subunit B [Anaerolineales bacterium]
MNNKAQSLILSTAIHYLVPLLLLFSVFLLMRGHNEPGGGFTGGLVAAVAFELYAISEGTPKVRQLLRIKPLELIAIGLAIAVGSGMIGLFVGDPFMTSLWSGELPLLGKIGTPVIFDVGVYLVVIGVVLTVMLALAEE